MFNANLYRWSGAALAVGSLLFIVNKFNDMSRIYLNVPLRDVIPGDNVLLVALGQILLVVGCLGCYLVYAKRTSRTGKIGLGLLLGGAILLAVGHVDFTPYSPGEAMFLLVILGGLLMFAGLVLFGAVNLRSRALAYWQPLPLVTGLLGIAGFILSGGSENNPFVFLALRTLFGIGLVLMGIVLWQDKGVVSTRVSQVV